MPSIRPATAADAQLIFDFIVELAVYEKAKHEVVTSVEEITENPVRREFESTRIDLQHRRQAGGLRRVFLQLFHLARQKRHLAGRRLRNAGISRQGAGKALLNHVAQIAVKENCGRFEWSVLNWNTPSIEFYESLGAKPLDEWTIYRLTGDALKALAAG